MLHLRLLETVLNNNTALEGGVRTSQAVSTPYHFLAGRMSQVHAPGQVSREEHAGRAANRWALR